MEADQAILLRVQYNMTRRSFSQFTLADALALVDRRLLDLWTLSVTPRPATPFFLERLQRLEVFDTARSEAGKLLIVDAFFEEALQPYRHQLRTFKEASLVGDQASGAVDYLVTPASLVPTTPLLCVAEAKKDDFEKGLAQCLVELHTCAQINAGKDHRVPVFGIVTNGTSWQFYRRTVEGVISESLPYGLANQELLLGVLDYLFAQCVQNLPT